ncbi:MAG: alpha/beta hydrolase [Pseudomonadota bacterium]
MTAAPVLPLPPGGVEPDICQWLTTPDGVRLRAARWTAPGARAHVVFNAGRTEFLEKLALPVAELVGLGLSVIAVDWRGQGLSDRLTEPDLKGHIGDFAEYQIDLDTLLASDLAQDLPGPRVLFAHSMGGAITARALTRLDQIGPVQATVMCAPMFGIAMTRVMRAFAWATVRISRTFGLEERWPPLGDPATPYVMNGFDDNVLTGDREIWEWMADVTAAHPAVGLGMPTLGWFSAAEAECARLRQSVPPGHPVLCLLGSNERVVDAAAVRHGAGLLGADLAEFSGGEHELFLETEDIRLAVWDRIERFLEQAGVPTADG